MNTTLRPTKRQDRIIAMDLLRGTALLGIFIVNLPQIAMLSSHSTKLGPEEGVLQWTAWGVLTGLCMTKFFTLFSLLFGMGLALQVQKAVAKGPAAEAAFAAMYKRRLAWLAVMGLLHGVLLFIGDILFVYALAGSLLFMVRRWPLERYLVAAAVFVVVGLLLSLSMTWLESLEPAAADSVAPTWPADVNLTVADILTHADADLPALEMKAYGEGPFGSTLLLNVSLFLAWLVASSLTSFNWRVLAYFCVGAALMKSGFFGADKRSWRPKMVRWGLVLGLPLQGLSLWLTAENNFAESYAVTLLNELAGPLLSMAYLGGIVMWADSGRTKRIVAGISSAGRMALTNYLGQSVAACLLFRWYGADLFDTMTRAELLLVAVVVWLAQIGLSQWWLSRRPMGPLEQVWRRLSYGRA